MPEKTQGVEKLRYKTVEIPKLARGIAREEGILAGISSGAAVWAASHEIGGRRYATTNW